MRSAGDIDEKRGIPEILGQQFVPVQEDFLGGIDGIIEREFLVENGFPGNERVGKRGGGFDGFSVMADAGIVTITLIGADQIGAGEFLDADADTGQVHRVDPVGAAAVGELRLVV